MTMNEMPPHRDPRLRFGDIYSELALNKAVLQVYTKPLFAWRKALSFSHDDKTLYDFARHTQRNVAQLHRSLLRRCFAFREARQLTYKVKNKQRVVYIFPWEERMVDRFLFDQMNRRCDHLFSKSSFAYRYRGYGVDVAQRNIARITRCGEPLFVLKRDVRNYFPSIDHQCLLDMLARWVEPDDYLFDLLRQRIEFRFVNDTVVDNDDKADDGDRGAASPSIVSASVGIPFGSPIACFFANLYLTPLDMRLSRLEGLHYFRYADDLLLASPSRDTAVAAGNILSETLSALKLRSKQSHHKDLLFSRRSGGDGQFEHAQRFRHLGLEFGVDGHVRLSRDKARKIRNLFRFAFRRQRRRFRRCQDPKKRAQLAIAIVQQVLGGGIRPVAIIDYYLKHVDDEQQLRLIDRWLAEEVLALALKTGHRKGNFRYISFAQLRTMGLPSLRHRHRLLKHGHITSSFFQLRTERTKEREMKSHSSNYDSSIRDTANSSSEAQYHFLLL